MARDEEQEEIDPSVIVSPGGRLAKTHALTARQAEAMASDLYQQVAENRVPDTDTQSD